jgi:hypothetical protein
MLIVPDNSVCHHFDKYGIFVGDVINVIDTPLPKGEWILGSTSPLNRKKLPFLYQRWFSPQAFYPITEVCSGMPYPTVQNR